jgi:hypothetical protein
MVRSVAFLALILLAFVTAGCSSSAAPAGRSDSQGRTRCLNDRNETGNSRPLFFLFCAESP